MLNQPLATERTEDVSNRLCKRFSNCGPRTTRGPRVLPLWFF